jgi:uncharacterized membrane protein
MKLEMINKDVQGVLHSRQVVGGLYVLGGLGGIFASLNLAIDRLILLSSPGAALNCDLSEEVSCGKVDQSWQASLFHWDSIPVPNAMIGLVFYAVLITVGVALAGGTQFPKWFNRAALGGQALMLVFSYWLLSQSYFGLLVKLPDGSDDYDPTPYGALCPWCVMLMFSTTIMTFMLIHLLVLSDASSKKVLKGKVLGLPEKVGEKWASFIANYFQYFILIALILVFIILILAKYHVTLLGV